MKNYVFASLILSASLFAVEPINETIKYTGFDENGETCTLKLTPPSYLKSLVSGPPYFVAKAKVNVEQFPTMSFDLMSGGSYLMNSYDEGDEYNTLTVSLDEQSYSLTIYKNVQTPKYIQCTDLEEE